MFVSAYDSLIPGAYKADFFRYLVLLKDGGVYADVDVLLNTNLDSFINPSMSFFAPLDTVGAFADASYCLWNGVMGAAPGHPFLIRAVERTLGLIRKKADLLDMEREVCLRNGRDTELWKMRLEPLLLLSGPCALGISINEVLGINSLTPFEPGLIQSEYYEKLQGFGDTVVLLVSLY